MMRLRNQIEFLRAGLGVRRYHQRYTSVIDTVGKHSAGVAGFLLLMYGTDTVPRGHLLAAAICHDLPECVTGDIPSPAKRGWSKEARDTLAKEEDRLLSDNDLQYNLTEKEEKELKLADCFDGLMFCIEERRRGNQEVNPVAATYITYLKQLNPQGIAFSIYCELVTMWNQANERE